jgi:hypothetical protein
MGRCRVTSSELAEEGLKVDKKITKTGLNHPKDERYSLDSRFSSLIGDFDG